ncbi:MAG: ribosomal RNA small subunit methyltransferase A [Candidatus Peribacteraceae bacterium]|nr:ribosomal RNA small subunit methyltransferase A [Candidatus Peribacteraceae bacterium]
MLRDTVGEFLHQNGIWLNKDLGQHFLIADDVLQAIVESGTIQPNDTIVEIGPGIGVLTAELLKSAKHVIAIELDAKLIPLLKKYTNIEQPATSNNLTILNQNALQTDFPDTPYKVIANIPYHITSPLLRHIFLEATQLPISLTLLIQREVAETICDTDNAGMLTILVGLFGTPHIVTMVDPSCFLPPPKVDSAVLHIECFPQAKTDRETIEEIFKLTKIAFSGKRKMLSNTLGNLPNGMEHMTAVSIDPRRRPQTLSIDEWIELAQAFRRR